MDKIAPAQALVYSTDGGYKLQQKKDEHGNVLSEDEFVGYGLARWQVTRWEESELGGRADRRTPRQGVVEDLLTWQEAYMDPPYVGHGLVPDERDRRRGGQVLGICGNVCYDRSRPEFNGARRKNANVAEVEAMIQMLLQVLLLRQPPPHVITVYKKLTGTEPVNKNGALVGVARVLLHRVRERGTTLHWVWVKGHCGHIANERADKLATTGMFKPRWRRYRVIPRSYLTANRRYVLAEDEERARAAEAAVAVWGA